ncbi:MAG: LysM peptidoglycan-binding domain-containing protein [Candidatus Acidiferrales bacterium]
MGASGKLILMGETMVRGKFRAALTLGAAVLLLGGCEDTAKHAVQVRPNVPVPTHAPQQAEILPFPPYQPFAGYDLLDRRPAVDTLMAKMQEDLNAGQAAFEAGKMDEARVKFNAAISLVMSSGIPVDSDVQLAALFDQILDTMHADALEDAQIAKTEGADEMAEPAPIDEIADLSTLPPGDPRLAEKAEQELMRVPHDLPLTVNDSVLQYLSFFQTERGRAIVETGLRRAGRYHDMIRRVLKEEGVPQDLIYLAQAESAFQPQAVSRAGARGIWQFMPYRGEEYDLGRSWYIDERSDPEKATHAAAHHLRDLYAMFGDWYLVMAAYNSGPGNVAKAIERTGYADFWELQKRNALPTQTKNYVPIILALALVAKDPALYGVQVDPDKPPDVDSVKPGHPIDLRLVADATGTELDDLRMLNPELLRLVTPDDSNFTLRLPPGTSAPFNAAIAGIPPDKWKSWRIHEVSEGETLAAIAKHYKVTAAAIEQTNHLASATDIAPGEKLTIPAAMPAQLQLVHYRVRRGDTLAGIAEQFSVTVADLKRWNGIRGSQAPRGARLRIYAGGDPSTTAHTKGKSAQSDASGQMQSVAVRDAKAAPADPVQYRVKAGETLYSIARQFGTSVDALRSANPALNNRALEVGDLLVVAPKK